MLRTILFTGIFLVCCVDAITPRDYCDALIYKQQSSPAFNWHPKQYIMPYYKRCRNHDEWVECMLSLVKEKRKDIVLESFELTFPPKIDMLAAGIILCDMKLAGVPPNLTNCAFNTTMCNKVYETGRRCDDAAKRATCIWGQLSKCGGRLKPLYDYEFGLLGRDCLVHLNLAISPQTRSSDLCENGSPKSPEPLAHLVLPLCSIIAFTALFNID